MANILSGTERTRQALSLSAANQERRHFQPMSLASLIRASRKRRGLTQVQLAHLMELSKGAVGQWELENGTSPSVDNMARLRDVLGIPATAEAAAGAPNGYQFVEDPEKLAWLTLFDLMDENERLVIARMIRGAVTLRTRSPT